MRVRPVREASNASRAGLLCKGKDSPLRCALAVPVPLLHAFLFGLIGLGILTAVVLPNKGFPVEPRAGRAPVAGLSLPGFSASSTEEPVLTSGPVTETVRREDVMAAIDASIQNALRGDSGGAQLAAAPPPARPLRPPTSSTWSRRATPPVPSPASSASGSSISSGTIRKSRTASVLVPGQVLIVPSDNGIIHFVRFGETLSDIAARYGVSLSAILNYPGNDFADPNAVVENELVFVPGGKPPVASGPRSHPGTHRGAGARNPPAGACAAAQLRLPTVTARSTRANIRRRPHMAGLRPDFKLHGRFASARHRYRPLSNPNAAICLRHPDASSSPAAIRAAHTDCTS